MNSYFYQPPLVKSSTKKFEVIRKDGEVVGSVQRYFNSKLHSIIDSIIGRNSLIVRVKGMHLNDNLMIDAYTQMAMIKRPYYYLRFMNGNWKDVTFRAIQTSNIKVNSEFAIKGDNGIDIIVKKDTFGWARFYEDQQEVARVRSNITEKFKTYIEIEKDASVQDPLFYAVYQQLLYFIGY